jgi:hypothetical protein
MNRALSRLLTGGFMVCAAGAAHAQNGASFVGKWYQTYSTAGQCPTCSITISPVGGGYSVTSSNGWTARLHGDGRSGSGQGGWDTKTPFNGPISVSLSMNGATLNLSMRATRSGASLSGTYSR